MKDRIGQAYLAAGGVVAGAGVGTLLAGVFTSFPLWGLIISGALALVGLYMMSAVLFDWWLPGRSSSVAYVIENARDLSAEILTWLGDRRRAEPSDSFDIAWGERNERSQRHSTETKIRWSELFGVRALAAYDQLVAHGSGDGASSGRSLFERPTNPLGMEEVGRSLGVMASHLEKKALSRR